VGVTSIQFSVDNQPVATATASPFSFSWNTTSVGNGSHTLTVAASDAAGNVGSASIPVSVNNPVVADTQPPSATITSPTNGAHLTTKNVQISVSASDNVGVTQVSIYVDNVLQCTDMTAPYTCSWNTRKAASGSHVITANAWDAAGNMGSAAPITVYK
jgi:Big-like domain-containing protein